jgi:lysophospholipase L1-like esterase
MENEKKGKLNIRILVFCVVFVLTALLICLFALRRPKALFPSMFQEKTQILFLGDSNIAFDFGGQAIPQMMEEKMDAVCYNCAVGGTCAYHKTEPYPLESFYTLLDLANITKMMETGDFTSITRDKKMLDQSGYVRGRMQALKYLDYEKMDYVIIHFGVNDYMASAPLEGKHADDDTSYAGSLRSSIKRIHKLCPDATIVISSIPFIWGYDKENDAYISGLEFDYGGGTIDRYFEASKEVAEEFPYVYFLDNLTGCVETVAMEDSPYHEDRIHYSMQGRELYTERLTKLLRELEQ